MKLPLSILIVSIATWGQPATPAPAPSAQPAWLANLPTSFVGAGGTWTRGANHPVSIDLAYGQRLAKGRWLAWLDLRTPVFRQAPGSPPIPSTFQGGAGYIPICSATGAVCVVMIALGGVAAAGEGVAAAPAFTGSLAIPIRLKGTLYVVPYGQASNMAYNTSSGALASAVMSPGVWIVYGFGK